LSRATRFVHRKQNFAAQITGQRGVDSTPRRTQTLKTHTPTHTMAAAAEPVEQEEEEEATEVQGAKAGEAVKNILRNRSVSLASRRLLPYNCFAVSVDKNRWCIMMCATVSH